MFSSRFLILLTVSLLLFVSVATAAPRLVPVATSDQLQNALAAVQEGDIIELADGTYSVNALSGAYDFFFIVDPAVHFTVRAETPGAAFLDGSSSGRIMEYRVDTPGAEGWVSFENLAFVNGRTTSFDSGGVMIRGGRSTFEYCVFQNNQGVPEASSEASAGALRAGTESVVQIVGCSFTGNISDNHGGAIIIGQGSTAYIHDSIFANNRTNLPGHRSNGLGGAIHVFNGLEGTTSYLYITNSRFSNNQAGFVGGGIMAKGNFASSTQSVASPTVVVVSNSTFEDNTALNDPFITPASPTEGGAIMAENNVSLSVYNSRFINNSGGLGGAISSFRGEVLVESSVFENNTAFGRSETDSTGRGGAIKSHSNDNCADDTDYRTGSLSVSDSFFEGNQAQGGGAIFAAGDTTRMFSTVPGCQMGNANSNRLPVSLEKITIADCSVDDVIGNHAVGGGLYGLLIDLTLTDSMVLTSVASGTDPSDFASSSQGHGGGASIRKASKISITGTTFAGNSADHEGGALHIHGSEVAAFDDNAFINNEVSPGGNRPETSSEGAAIYVSPSTPDSLSVSGSISNSIFSNNLGLPIFDSDTTDANGCDCFNLVTYDGNTFYNTAYGDSVYRNSLVQGTHTAQELNSLVVDHGGSTQTKKSVLETNADTVSPIVTAALLATPERIIDSTAAGDIQAVTESFLAWSWNGGCAELDQSNLNSGTEETGALSSTIGSHTLSVWSGGSCSGASDASVNENILTGATPAADLIADPIAISGGEQTTLSWDVTAGSFLIGMISNDAKDAVPQPTGSVMVAPPASTRYHLSVVTREGGVSADERVFVDEEPPTTIFTDGFESGDTSAWSGVTGH